MSLTPLLIDQLTLTEQFSSTPMFEVVGLAVVPSKVSIPATIPNAVLALKVVVPPVPPLATGRVFATFEVRSIDPAN